MMHPPGSYHTSCARSPVPQWARLEKGHGEDRTTQPVPGEGSGTVRIAARNDACCKCAPSFPSATGSCASYRATEKERRER